MIETLWKRHYHSGVTGSYHGDMAHAFHAMLNDKDIDTTTVSKIWRSIHRHISIERHQDHKGRQWFCEKFSAGSGDVLDIGTATESWSTVTGGGVWCEHD